MEIIQLQINFIQMLEKRYEVDIKRTVDYVEIRNKWISEGSTMPTPPKVQPRASKGLRVGNEIGLDRREHPIRWDDLLEE